MDSNLLQDPAFNLAASAAGNIIGHYGIQSIDKLASMFPVLNLKNDKTAFDVLVHHIQPRIESMIALKEILLSENSNLQDQRTELEKISPASGMNRTIHEYLYGVLDDKLEALRNALLNGLYGDYTIELREDLYRICNELQPLDIGILKHLVAICPNQYSYWSFQDRPTLGEGFRGDLDCGRLDLKTIVESFKIQKPDEIRRSLDRLQKGGLVYNDGGSCLGDYNPYARFIPLEMAQTFLNFISDPRNTLRTKMHA